MRPHPIVKVTSSANDLTAGDRPGRRRPALPRPRWAARALVSTVVGLLVLGLAPGDVPGTTGPAGPPDSAVPATSTAVGATVAEAAAFGGVADTVPLDVAAPVVPAALTSVSFHTVVSGLTSPVAMAAPNDGTGRLFVLEQAGRIRIVQSATLVAAPYLDIRGKVSCCGERGLLGIAFHPQFATNHRFFVFYTNNAGNLQVSEFRQNSVNHNRAVTTERKILAIPHSAHANHNGGQLAFGPDGYLYIGVGDGGGAGDPFRSGQSRTTLLGKILRIDVNGSTSTRHYLIPPTNPYARSTTRRREIWAFGLRNPWRFSFDRSTGDLWIGDVGQDRYEEVDRAPRSAGGGRGKNFGWSVVEGRTCYRPATGCNKVGKTSPVAVYSHSGGSCSITGGFVYRGSSYPAMRGKYFLADYCSGKVWTLNAASSVGSLRLVATVGFSISSWGQSVGGELYALDYSGGRLVRVRTP